MDARRVRTVRSQNGRRNRGFCGSRRLLASAGMFLVVMGWAAPLSHPAVDGFNLRAGTQTFAGRYQFTGETLLVETALAVREMGSDILKFYLGRDFPRQYGITLPAGINSLTALARDEPSCRRVLDLPFRHLLVWAYGFSPGGDTYWADGLSATERQREYAELYALTVHLLTTYNGTGKSFYLGHWEGDWYLLPNYVVTTNPTATRIQGMRDWLNTRQQAVDDARRNTPHSNVNVYVYAEVNRVRDAMVNGPGSNQRLVNQVLPAITNLDFVSWSAYDGQDLSRTEFHRTLDYIESQLSTNKAGVIPGRRVFIGEYGWGGSLSSAAQEPRTRGFLRHAIDWGASFVLFWQMYNNEPDRSYWLIDSSGQRTPCYDLHARFLNQARLEVGRFHQDQGRLPGEAEFAALMTPYLGRAFPAPVSLAVSNATPIEVGPSTAQVRVSLRQGIYGEEQARVKLHWGRQDGGADAAAWEQSVDLGLNTRFGPALFAATLAGLEPNTTYFYRGRATNAQGASWAATSASVTTTPPAPQLREARVTEGVWQTRVGDNAVGMVAAGCQIQVTTNLAVSTPWSTVWSGQGVLLPFVWTDTELAAQPQKFYRVLFEP